MENILEHLQNKHVIQSVKIRNTIKECVRSELKKNGFLEFDTPILSPKVPEYTNDQYQVLGENGEEYYLPQSPQLYKQTLLSAGFDKYFQFAHCFRYGEYDHDHINEFMQIDVEMQTHERKDLMKYVETLIRSICTALGMDCPEDFPIVSGDECYKKYGTDKPDLRKKKDELQFVWIVDLPLLESAGFERLKVVSGDIGIGDEKYHLSHHAFAQPLNWPKHSEVNLSDIKTNSFDLVCNGIEICSGDIRINDVELQKEVFSKLNIYSSYYNHYLKLLNPLKTNGGFAIGLDRLTMALMHATHVKDITLFTEGWYPSH